MHSILLCDHPDNIEAVYPAVLLDRLQKKAGLDRHVYTKAELLGAAPLPDVSYIFSTWGMPVLSEDEIRRLLPSLQGVFYSAGSVQAFARPFLRCGVRIWSAWAANAVPVAEYTTAQIVLANKGFFLTSRLQKAQDYAGARAAFAQYPGNYGAAVGLIGAGMIGKLVIRMLKSYRLPVKVFDPFLSEKAAADLGVELIDLPSLFSSCQVVSNHLANNAQTAGMLRYEHFRLLPPYATFINTGRGAQVVEADLVRALTERPDLTALLDVTSPEPPQPGHPFYSLPGCVLTPHIAGSSGDEVHRMAELMEEEYLRLCTGEPSRYEVTQDMLTTMA